MNSAPIIGVVVPVYKTKKKYLDQCVDSICRQTHRDLQIVLVDDASPDDCGCWCDEYAAQDPRITVCHHEQNKGLPAARNTGFDALMPEVEWVTFIDSDDWLDPDTVEKSLAAALEEDAPPDMVIFPACRNYPELEVPATLNRRCWRTREELDDLAFQALLIADKHVEIRAAVIDSAWARLVSVPFMKKANIRFRPLPYREDGMFFQEVVQNASFIKEIDTGLYHYRETNGSMVNSYRPRAGQEQRLYLDMLQQYYIDHGVSEKYREAMYYYALPSMQTVITQFFYHKKNKMGHRERRQACREYFSHEPYRDVFRVVKMGRLKRNYFIKALCMRLGWYGGVQLLRSLYLKKNARVCFD